MPLRSRRGVVPPTVQTSPGLGRGTLSMTPAVAQSAVMSAASKNVSVRDTVTCRSATMTVTVTARPLRLSTDVMVTSKCGSPCCSRA